MLNFHVNSTFLKGQLVPTILMPGEQSRELIVSTPLCKAGMVLTAACSLKEQHLCPGEFQGLLEFTGCLMEGELKSPTVPDFLSLKLSGILKTVNYSTKNTELTWKPI